MNLGQPMSYDEMVELIMRTNGRTRERACQSVDKFIEVGLIEKDENEMYVTTGKGLLFGLVQGMKAALEANARNNETYH